MLVGDVMRIAVMSLFVYVLFFAFKNMASKVACLFV